MMLLAFGLYLMNEQFMNPLQSTGAELILAAVLLTTSLVMFSAIANPSRTPRLRLESWSQLEQPLEMFGNFKSITKMPQRCEESRLPTERYVDRTQIRLLAAPQARGMAGK